MSKVFLLKGKNTVFCDLCGVLVLVKVSVMIYQHGIVLDIIFQNL